jgi:hypothetical protein
MGEINHISLLNLISSFKVSKFSWRDIRSNKRASIAHHCQKRYKDNMKFELETFQFAPNMLKK